MLKNLLKTFIYPFQYLFYNLLYFNKAIFIMLQYISFVNMLFSLKLIISKNLISTLVLNLILNYHYIIYINIIINFIIHLFKHLNILFLQIYYI